MFQPVKPRESATEACARAIREAILRGDLGPGDRLPPERKLAETFEVNRLTLRAALAQLSVAGLVVARQGSGYIVQDYARRGGPDLLPGIARLAYEQGDLAEVINDLLAVRRSLARVVFERIAEHADDDAIAEVVAEVERFAAVVESGADLEAIAAADVDVAAALVAATGSAVLALCLNPLSTVVAEMAELREAIYADPASNVAGYRLLLEWLRDRPTERIDDMMSLLAQRDAATDARLANAKGDDA